MQEQQASEDIFKNLFLDSRFTYLNNFPVCSIKYPCCFQRFQRFQAVLKYFKTFLSLYMQFVLYSAVPLKNLINKTKSYENKSFVIRFLHFLGTSPYSPGTKSV